MNHSPYPRLTFMTFLQAAYILVLACPSLFAGERPNIILCMGDDHGWDETGYNGHPYLKTPVLDKMAASGLCLNRFFSAHPSCSPTRGSIITGRHPNRYGTFTPNCSIRPEEVSIAQILSKAGYLCGHFGKWHLGPVKLKSPTSPGAMGFDEWLSHDNFFELNPVLSHNGGSPKHFQGESSEILVDQSLQFIGTATKRKQPFFLVIWFGSPHEPYSGLEEDLALYDNLPAEWVKQQVGLTSNETGRPTKRPLKDVLRERYAEITAMDRSIGQLRDSLEEHGMRENTLLWYCGDNGSPSGAIETSPFRGLKGTMYDGGIRVPGIIEWPKGISAAQTSDVNTVTSDILPTICDLLELDLPDRPLDGISLQPLIEGKMTERPSPIFFWSFRDTTKGRRPYIDPELQTGTTPLVKMLGGRFTRNFQNFHHAKIEEQDYEGPRVVLNNRYKLVVDEIDSSKETQRVELFDIREDPAETDNLAGSKPTEVADLKRKLREWQDSVLKSLIGADYR